MRRLATLAAVAAAALSGCDALPGGGDLPGATGLEARITEGEGTADAFRPRLEVRPGNVIQLRLTLADGEQAEVSARRGPAQAITIVAESDDGSRTEIDLGSATGSAFALGDAFEFTPGHVGVRKVGGDDRVALILNAPRTIGAPQTQFEFTLKLNVV